MDPRTINYPFLNYPQYMKNLQLTENPKITFHVQVVKNPDEDLALKIQYKMKTIMEFVAFKIRETVCRHQIEENVKNIRVTVSRSARMSVEQAIERISKFDRARINLIFIFSTQEINVQSKIENNTCFFYLKSSFFNILPKNLSLNKTNEDFTAEQKYNLDILLNHIFFQIFCCFGAFKATHGIMSISTICLPIFAFRKKKLIQKVKFHHLVDAATFNIMCCALYRSIHNSHVHCWFENYYLRIKTTNPDCYISSYIFIYQNHYTYHNAKFDISFKMSEIAMLPPIEWDLIVITQWAGPVCLISRENISSFEFSNCPQRKIYLQK